MTTTDLSYAELTEYPLLTLLMQGDRDAATEMKRRFNTTDVELLLYLFTMSNLVRDFVYDDLVAHVKQAPTVEALEAKLLEIYDPLALEGIYQRVQDRLRELLTEAFKKRASDENRYAVMIPSEKASLYTLSLLKEHLTDRALLPDGWAFDGLDMTGDDTAFLFYVDQLPTAADTAYVEYKVRQIRERYDGFKIDMDKAEQVAAELKARAARVDEEMDRGFAKDED